ncbi:MAG: phosphatidic acid phosphatase [Ruminococcaceae bacterium]|nr:phosphatidic acid phosphatase [Oscillospiraceae bacterium]
MRKPVVDYRKLRLSNITTPQYRHLLLLLGWVVYFCLYFLTENLIPAEKCYPVWCKLDDLIPFHEAFVIFYVGWYVLIVLSLGYFLLYSVESFKGLQTYIMVTQALAMICYIAFPTRQDLRPETFPRENFLTWIMGIIYQFDTNTGVCPSLHVAYSIGIASAWLKEKSAAWYVKVLVTVFVVGVCLSVAFTKQHSVVDIFAALPVCAVAELFAFRKYYQARKKVKL